MAKRRAGSPETDRARKRLSLTALAAKASSGSLRYEQEGSFLNIFLSHHRLRKASTMSLRSTSNISKPLLRPAPLRPGLELSGRSLQTHSDHDVASIKELLVFPTSLAMIKPNWIFRYTMNSTPQLGPSLPEHIESQLYDKYVSTRLHPRPERLPYIHLGSTALGFRLNFYLVLPCATTSSRSSGTGNMCYKDIELIYDRCIRPALEAAYPRRQGWPEWTAAKNESHLKPLKCRRRSSIRSEAQEERVHCDGLGLFWSALEEFSENPEVARMMRGKQLIAYGDVAVHDWQTDWRPTWAQFTQLWNDGVEADYVGLDTKITMELSLGFEESCATMLSGFPPHRCRTPGSRCLSPMSDVYSPPFSAPPAYPMSAIPALSVHKRGSRRLNSRNSIKLVEPDFAEASDELGALYE